jgi:hypothetical protein
LVDAARTKTTANDQQRFLRWIEIEGGETRLALALHIQDVLPHRVSCQYNAV